jgi:hypothetical protein
LIANSNSAALAKAETTIVAQLPTVLGKVTIPINGQMLTTVQIVALVQGHLDALTELVDLRAQTAAAILAERTQRKTVKAAVICIRNYVASAFGDQSSQYASLGFAPRKVAQKSAESKAQAVNKLLATRAARHTMGKRQKAEIHGDVSAPASAGSSSAATTGASAGGQTAASGAAAAGSTSAPVIGAVPASNAAPNGASSSNGASAAGSNVAGSNGAALPGAPATGQSGH